MMTLWPPMEWRWREDKKEGEGSGEKGEFGGNVSWWRRWIEVDDRMEFGVESYSNGILLIGRKTEEREVKGDTISFSGIVSWWEYGGGGKCGNVQKNISFLLVFGYTLTFRGKENKCREEERRA